MNEAEKDEILEGLCWNNKNASSEELDRVEALCWEVVNDEDEVT